MIDLVTVTCHLSDKDGIVYLFFLSTKHDQDRHLNLFDEYFENNKILVGERRNREEYCFNYIVNNKI